MRLLLTNDDGFQAPGLKLLTSLIPNHWEPWVVAPDGERSAISHAFSLHHPLRIHNIDEKHYITTGTPADCVHLGLFQCMKEKPSWVFSGINHGPNLGIDVHYSGTVAAAKEATIAGFPAAAFSLAANHLNDENQQLITQQMPKILGLLETLSLPKQTLLNINFPAFRENHTPTIEFTKLGHVRYHSDVLHRKDGRDRSYYWLGGQPPEYGNEPGTDTACILAGNISITPIHLDLTAHDYLKNLQSQIDL